ncbi:MAG: TolC family outer membrane protein [Holosporales bacterium]
MAKLKPFILPTLLLSAMVIGIPAEAAPKAKKEAAPKAQSAKASKVNTPKAQQGKKDSSSPAPTSQQAKAESHPFVMALMRAYECNPEFKARLADFYGKAEAVPRALAEWFPTLSLSTGASRNITRTDRVISTGGLFGPAGYRKAGKNNARTSTYSAAIELRQNLFSSGRTVAATNAAEYGVLAAAAGVVNAEQSLLLSAAQAYLDLWAAEAAVEYNRANVKFLKKTMDQARARYELGDLTLTDLAQAEAGLAQGQTSLINAQARVQDARAVYLQIIGEEPSALTLPEGILEQVELPKTVNDLVMIAQKDSPSIVAANYSQKAAESNISQAQAAFGPSVDLRASASRSIAKRRPLTETSPHFNPTNQADVGVTLSLPIFQGGKDWSQLREATQQAYQARYSLANAQRAAAQAATQAWDKWRSSEQAVAMYKSQVRAAEIAREGAFQESLVGERTIIDVLKSEEVLLQARTSLVQAKRDFLLARFQLLASIGQLTVTSLGLPVERYNVEQYADDVKFKLIGLGNIENK